MNDINDKGLISIDNFKRILNVFFPNVLTN